MNGGYGSGTLTAGYIKLGNLYQEIQHYDAAKHCYLEAISVSSDNPADITMSASISCYFFNYRKTPRCPQT